jgi:hypothetical protein
MTQEEEIAQLNKQLQEVLQRLSEAEQRERLLQEQGRRAAGRQAGVAGAVGTCPVADRGTGEAQGAPRFREGERDQVPGGTEAATQKGQPSIIMRADESSSRASSSITSAPAGSVAVACEGRVWRAGGRVIELPPPPLVKVTEHVVYHG